jgi:hypothetical protein
MHHPLIALELERMRVEMLRAEAGKRRRRGHRERRPRRVAWALTGSAVTARGGAMEAAGTMRRVLQITSRARDALRASVIAAARFDPEARIRLAADSTAGVRADLVHAGEPGDDELTLEDLSVLVDPTLQGTVDTGDHNAFVLVRD